MLWLTLLPRGRMAGCARNSRPIRNVSPGVTSVRMIGISGNTIVTSVHTIETNGSMIVARDPIAQSGLNGRTDGIDPPHRVLSGLRLICASFLIRLGSSSPPSCARRE